MDKHIEALRNAALKATRDKWVAFSNVKTGTFAASLRGGE
ncbi:Uncharacterised protein [Yersinia nurmii]|uniref:Uncharacterized protein n=1 Tax=Yersinia nurmii TaxID=685706 RepID=A0ABM9SPE8_9GAMM|nr:Uncharacterised protein [Yersinia nurmii]